MPNWQPNWQDVRWNQAAASRAIAELRRVAEELDETAGERARVAGEATAQWQGDHRRAFDGYLAAVLTDARRLAHAYREAARQIAQASERARVEQAHRERERARWRREQAAERRRDQQPVAGRRGLM
jgi:uncharacterized protein YukE